MAKHVCSKCGSEHIQVRVWVNPNTNEMHDWAEVGNDNECWCEDCEELTTCDFMED